MRYGYIGLGHLGGHLAANLLKAGYQVTVHDLDRSLAERHLAMGAAWADNPQALAENSDAVFTCLPSPAISKRVLVGPHGILEGLKPGGTWIEMSTLGREDIMTFAALAAPRGISVLESPVTGGVHRAATGDITILAGGEKWLFDQHRPALQAMGDEIFHMGPLGSASIIKVITNMLAFIHLVAAGEALMLAKRGGLDLAQAFRAIKASSGNSFVHETESQLILNGSYDVGFTMDLALKDLGFAMRFGEEFRVPLALASQTAQIFKQAQQAYGGSAWSTQVV